jgi:NAD(P)-dependent dehydrogenase (short-subunit alcohol dehydrogenase family)
MSAEASSQKVALVTGSTRGIGLAIAERLVADGFRVVTNGRSTPKRIIGDEHIQADITQQDDLATLIEFVKKKYGNIDVLVCNVGSGKQTEVSVPEDRWKHFLSMNLFSAVYLIQALINESLLKQAKIIGISSIASAKATSAPIEYSASKAALDSYFKNLAFFYANSGMNFNLLSLGNVLFPGSTWEEKIKSNKDSVNKYIADNVPANRLATLDEIADVASFLASTKCGFMTGATITVDGGQTL